MKSSGGSGLMSAKIAGCVSFCNTTITHLIMKGLITSVVANFLLVVYSFLSKKSHWRSNLRILGMCFLLNLRKIHSVFQGGALCLSLLRDVTWEEILVNVKSSHADSGVDQYLDMAEVRDYEGISISVFRNVRFYLIFLEAKQANFIMNFFTEYSAHSEE